MNYSCTYPECDKSYQREEHLRRHERQHVDNNRYACRQCGKLFVRSDVLSRHMAQTHGISPSSKGRPAKVSCTSCRRDRATCDGKSGSTCTRCRAERLACRYTTSRSASPEPRADPSAEAVGQNAIASYQDERQDSLEALMVPRWSMGAAGPSSLPTIPTVLPSVAQPDLILPQPSFLDFNAFFPDASDWGFGDAEGDIFDILNTHPPGSPIAEWGVFPSIETSISRPLGDASSGIDVSPDRLHGTPSEIPDGQPYDSPWPHIDKPRTPDAHIKIPQLAPPSSTLPISPVEVVQDSTRSAMLSLIENAHHGPWPMVDIGNFPSVETLTICVRLYFRHFHDWLPVLDREIFNIASAPPLLLMSMSAIGATYTQDELSRLGIALNELVRRGVSFVREHDRRFMFETNIIQASLLQACFAFYSGSPKLFQQAESFRGVLVTACKRMHLLRPGASALTVLKQRIAEPSPSDVVAARVEDDRRRRLGWGIYILDAQLGCLLNLPAQLSVAEVMAPIPVRTNGSSLVHGDGIGEITFGFALDQLLSSGVFPPDLDDLGFCIMSYTLYRLCIDAAAVQSLHTSTSTHGRYGVQFAPHIRFNPQLLLDQIAQHSLQLAKTPTCLSIACVALAYHSHLQFTILGFIELAKVAAGKSGTADSKQRARQQLCTRLTDSVGARNIYANAAMLTALLGRYQFDVPTESVWNFDAALSLWAVTKFAVDDYHNSTRLNPRLPPVIFSWARSTLTDDWIAHGGQAGIPNLGLLPGITTTSILKHFVDRMRSLSWGLAQQYSEVLSLLMQEDA